MVDNDPWLGRETFCLCRWCISGFRPSSTTRGREWRPGVCRIDTLTIYRSRHSDLLRKISSDIKNAVEGGIEAIRLHAQLNHERNHQRNMSPFLRCEGGGFEFGDPLDPDSVICLLPGEGGPMTVFNPM